MTKYKPGKIEKKEDIKDKIMELELKLTRPEKKQHTKRKKDTEIHRFILFSIFAIFYGLLSAFFMGFISAFIPDIYRALSVVFLFLMTLILYGILNELNKAEKENT